MAQDCYSYYLEAIALKEQERMPVLGCSVDRRAFKHVRADLAEQVGEVPRMHVLRTDTRD